MLKIKSFYLLYVHKHHMPQISPMLWFFLFLYFLGILLVTISKMHFNFKLV